MQDLQWVFPVTGERKDERYLFVRKRSGGVLD